MGIKKPLEVKLQLTEECNFDCSFCFNKQGSPNTQQLPAKIAEKAITKVAEEGIEKIRFTGGEPLLHPDFFKLASLAKKKGLSTMLNTNASLITEKNASQISGSCDNILISMHSLPPRKQTKQAIALLSKQGVFLRAATILSKENIKNLEKFHQFILESPFKQWVLLRQIPNYLNKTPVEREDVEQAVEKISCFNKGRSEKERFLIENALPFCCSNPDRVSEVCLGGIHEDGHSNLLVDALGKIRPSYFLEAELGQVENTGFLEAWETDFMKRMNSLEFIADVCHKCKYVLKCMSGSRFSALFAKNSLYALDPLAKPSQFEKELGLI